MEVPAAFLLVLAFRKRSIDTAIDDGGGDEVTGRPIGDSPPNTRAGGLRSRRRFEQWGVC